MTVFLTRLKDLVKRSGQSWAPRDILFDAQLPFLRHHFGDYLLDLERPKDGGPFVFRCKFPPDLPISRFRDSVCSGNWGSFKVIDIRIRCDGTSPTWPQASVLVDLA